MPGLRQHRVMRAANYLSVTVTDRIDQSVLHSVCSVRYCSLAREGLGLEMRGLSREQGEEVSGF